MLPKSRYAFVGFVVIAAFLLSYDASAASTEGALTAGTTRYAVVSSTAIAVTSAEAFAVIPGLSTTIVIPSNKKGDVIVSFCGESNTIGEMMVRAMIGGVIASPPQMAIRANVDFGSRCADFYRLNVPAGHVSVKMQWEVYFFYPGDIYLYNRSMIVTTNIH